MDSLAFRYLVMLAGDSLPDGMGTTDPVGTPINPDVADYVYGIALRPIADHCKGGGQVSCEHLRELMFRSEFAGHLIAHAASEDPELSAVLWE